MPSELTTIISILIPVIGMQIIIMLFIFRRMDRAEERQTQERREMEQRLIRRMDTMDANQTQERRQTEQRLVQQMNSIDERQTQERRETEQRLVKDIGESEQRLIKRMDKTDEEVSEMRAGMYSISDRLARIEGAVEVLRDMVERFVTARQ